MHLKAQKHQFARYMQNKYEDFPESPLQQFNFQRVKESTPAVKSEEIESERESEDTNSKNNRG